MHCRFAFWESAALFQWAKDSLIEGNLQDAIDGKDILSVHREGNTLAADSNVTVSAGGREQETSVVGILGDVPYSYGVDSNTGSITGMAVCLEELFRKLTGEDGYAVLDVQLNQDATDSQVQEIRKVMEQECEGSVAFSDKRIGNKETKGASYSMSVFLYGFLAVIALIGFLISSITLP